MTMSSTKMFIVTGLGPAQVFDLYDEAFTWATGYASAVRCTERAHAWAPADAKFKFGEDSNLRCRFKILEFDTKVVYEDTGDSSSVQR